MGGVTCRMKLAAQYGCFLTKPKKRFGISEVSVRNQQKSTQCVKNLCRNQKAFPNLEELTDHEKKQTQKTTKKTQQDQYDIISR